MREELSSWNIFEHHIQVGVVLILGDSLPRSCVQVIKGKGFKDGWKETGHAMLTLKWASRLTRNGKSTA